MLFNNIYSGKRVLVTGHTGFKGSWLCLWLKQMGADILGYSLKPTTSPDHYSLTKGSEGIISVIGDIRDKKLLEKTVSDFNPEIIFHLAAQSLVSTSYDRPEETWGINLIGTLNLLEICRKVSSLKAILVVTTDKVYENAGTSRYFGEDDPLGGYDPYSASKAAAELLVQSYRRSFYKKLGINLSTARAGNVIGGGDWAQDRLIPDIIKASVNKTHTNIRNPDAIRPWQHVLDSLSGYLILGQHMLQSSSQIDMSWNFGPNSDDCLSVSDILKEMSKNWPALTWRAVDTIQNKHEMQTLKISSQKAKHKLSWEPVWNIQTAVKYTVNWYQQYYADGKCLSQVQLIHYINYAKAKESEWTIS